MPGFRIRAGEQNSRLQKFTYWVMSQPKLSLFLSTRHEPIHVYIQHWNICLIYRFFLSSKCILSETNLHCLYIGQRTRICTHNCMDSLEGVKLVKRRLWSDRCWGRDLLWPIPYRSRTLFFGSRSDLEWMNPIGWPSRSACVFWERYFLFYICPSRTPDSSFSLVLLGILFYVIPGQ